MRAPRLTRGSGGRRARTGRALVLVLAVTLPACGVLDREAARTGPSGTARLEADPGPTGEPGTTAGGPAGTMVVPAPRRVPRVEDSTTTTVATATTRRATPRPTRPSLASQFGEDVTAAELRVPPEPPATGAWSFIGHAADGPVTFDACRPIHYLVRTGPGPADAEALVAEALARVAEVSGLRFVEDGPVDAAPTSASFPAKDAAVELADAFAPVVIGWAAQGETDLWASETGDTLGVGGPRTIVFRNDEALSVSGFALLVPSDSLTPGFGPGTTVGNVLLHEIGHVVGLDHVEALGEVMQARLDHSAPDGWGPGDRRGLWELGATRGCASSYLQPGG